MPIRTITQATTVGRTGAKFTSADAGTAVFTIDPADGGANFNISVHAGGVMYADPGDIVTCNGTYSFTRVSL